MKRTIYLSSLLCLTIITIQGQVTFNNKMALDFYNKGVNAFYKEQFLTADSLFTLSIQKEPNKHSFYNRGMAKLILGDTCSSCKDFIIAGKIMSDDQSLVNYYKYCLLKRDTVYFDRKHQLTLNRKKYRYFDEKMLQKCDSLEFGFIYLNNDYSVEGEMMFLTKTIKKGDPFASYIIKDTVRYYNQIFPSLLNNENSIIIDDFSNRLKTFLNIKYDLQSIPYKERFISGEIYIDDKGNMIDYEVLYTPFDRLEEKSRKDILIDINKSILTFPKLSPNKLLNRKVNILYSFCFEI